MKKKKPSPAPRRNGGRKPAGEQNPIADGSRALMGTRVDCSKLTAKELRACADDAMRELEKRACAGDRDAAGRLVGAAVCAVDRLSSAMQDSAELRRLVNTSAHWPVLFPAKSGKQKALAKQMGALDFAKGCETNELGKFDPQAPLSKAVFYVFHFLAKQLRDYSRPVPLVFATGAVTDDQREKFFEWAKQAKQDPRLSQRLTRDNARKWADLTEPVLEIFWGPEFENHRDFANYLRSHGPKAHGEILRVWRQSWRSIANL